MQVRRTRRQLYEHINGDYYGFRDEEDGVLERVEAEAELLMRGEVRHWVLHPMGCTLWPLKVVRDEWENICLKHFLFLNTIGRCLRNYLVWYGNVF